MTIPFIRVPDLRRWQLVVTLFLAALSLAGQAGDLRLTGRLVQGAVVTGQTEPGTAVWLNDEPVMVTPDGRFLLGFDRDAPAEATLSVRPPDGERENRILKIEAREYAIQRIDGLPPAKVTPPPEVLERIRRESAQVAAARRRADSRGDWLGGFVWPVTGPISGVYGSQRILNGQPRRPHYGIDVARPTGTPVVAPADGVVTLAEPDLYFSGGTLIIDHGHQLSSSFLHLSELHAEAGQAVRQGQVVGAIGATGRVTGAHLDWRMNWKKARVDPQLLVPPMPESQPGE